MCKIWSKKKSPRSSDCIYSIFLYHRVFRKLSLQTCNFFNGRSVIFLFVSDSFYLLSGSFSIFALHTMWVIDVVQKAVEEGEGSSTPKCLGLGVSETLSSSSNCRSVATRHDHPEGPPLVFRGVRNGLLCWFVWIHFGLKYEDIMRSHYVGSFWIGVCNCKGYTNIHTWDNSD